MIPAAGKDMIPSSAETRHSMMFNIYSIKLPFKLSSAETVPNMMFKVIWHFILNLEFLGPAISPDRPASIPEQVNVGFPGKCSVPGRPRGSRGGAV